MAHERVQLAVLGHPQGEGALAPSVTDDQCPHSKHRTGWRSSCRRTAREQIK
jgi:hypothetical protein